MVILASTATKRPGSTHSKRVDLDQGGIQFQKGLPQLAEKLDERRDQVCGEPQTCGQPGRRRLVERMFRAKGEPLEPGLPVLNPLLDIVAPFRRRKNDDFGGCGTDVKGKIKALQGLDGGFDQDLAHKMASWRRLFGCETSTKQIACRSHRFFRRRDKTHAAGTAPRTSLDLRLDGKTRRLEVTRDIACLLFRRHSLPGGHAHAAGRQQHLGLELMQVHAASPFGCRRRCEAEPASAGFNRWAAGTRITRPRSAAGCRARRNR